MKRLDSIIEMADGFMISKVLFAAVKFNIFTTLSKSEKNARELSQELSIPERSLSKLLDVCASLELLNKKNGKYSNTQLSEKYLVEGKPEYFGYYCNARNNMLYSEYSNLEELIMKDNFIAAVEGKSDDIIKAVSMNKDFARKAMMAQHNYSQQIARDFAAALDSDFSKHRVMLDAGGGTGIFSVETVKRFRNLNAIVFDRAYVLGVAEDIIAEHNVSDRVRLHPGDIMTDAFPAGADVVLISGILDGYNEKDCLFMLKKAYDYLPKGGKFILTECVINDERSGPVFPALFGLLLLLRTKEGDARSRGEMAHWVSEVGFDDINYKELTEISGSYRATGMIEAIKK